MTTDEAGPGGAHPAPDGPAFAVPARAGSEGLAPAGSEGLAPAGPGLADDTALWVVRHGETEWSRNGRHTGTTDIPLTAAGVRQAQALTPVLDAVGPVRVLSSPRARALDTARLAGVEVDEITEDLAEWDYGDYEGVTTGRIHEDVPDWSVFTHGCPGGETVAAVGARADRLLARVLALLADGPVMVFGHGHFSRVLGARWIGLPVSGGANLLLGTAAPSVLGAEHGGPALAHWNLPNPVA